MWTAEILPDRGKDERGVTITVVYSDGGSATDHDVLSGISSKDELDGIIRAKLAKLNANAAVVDDIEAGPYTPKVVDQDARVLRLQEALQRFSKWDRCVKMGCRPADYQKLEDARKAVVDAFDDDLIDFFVG